MESGAFADFALYPKLTAVRFDPAARDRQA